MAPDDTVVACLTPAGTGPIATLAVRGPNAWPAVREIFRTVSNRPLPEDALAAGSVWIGRCGDSGLADEVVLTARQVEPQPWLEIHCHGGPQVVAWLIETLQRHATACSWEEFLRITDRPRKAAALEHLARTATARTAAILLDQAHGALERAIESIRNSHAARRLHDAQHGVDELLRYAPVGGHLVVPWRVVVAGAPNVGKSSLVNALVGFQRSVVAPIPGTTRDIVSTASAFDGWPVELSDTAGIRADAGELEHAGIDLARNALESADLCIWVVDAAAVEPVWPARTERAMIAVINKCDLPSPWMTNANRELRVSALTSEGLGALSGLIARTLVPDPPPAGVAVLFLPGDIAHLIALRRALQAGNVEAAAEALEAIRI